MVMAKSTSRGIQIIVVGDLGLNKGLLASFPLRFRPSGRWRSSAKTVPALDQQCQNGAKRSAYNLTQINVAPASNRFPVIATVFVTRAVAFSSLFTPPKLKAARLGGLFFAPERGRVVPERAG